MKLATCLQRSPEWFALKKGKLSGTKFGQLISDRENRLKYELLNEMMNEYLFPEDYVSDEMQFGIDNEPVARKLYNEQTGINFEEVGAILSDFSEMHLASPDGVAGTRVLEIKCTENGAIHLQRFFQGVESAMMPQVVNYFAVSDEVEEVHWISYCPYRPERPIVGFIFTRKSVYKYDRKGVAITIDDVVLQGRELIKALETELSEMLSQFKF